MNNQTPLSPIDFDRFTALLSSISKATRNIEPGTDFQKGAISAFNDVLDMIERILK